MFIFHAGVGMFSIQPIGTKPQRIRPPAMPQRNSEELKQQLY